ncbi:cell division protein FtsZ [bacterium]|nr:cell division protein FtsZ [candidate division CSSED10-310 bacterium]
MKYSIETPSSTHAIIKVIGIGGGGCNAVNRMIDLNLAGIDFIACNTDLQALSGSKAPKTVQLGANLTRGLGAGGNPKIGREAALEDDEAIRSLLEGADMVFITAGMGGGTGTGGAPVVAQIAKELGSLAIAVVTKPFRFEGRRRTEIADSGIRDLEEFVDTLITIPNQKLLASVEQNTTLKAAFILADEVLGQAVQGISDLITVPGLINLDFADVKTIMSDMGKALMGTGTGIGPNKATEAVRRAIESPLLDDLTVNGARGILINLTGGEDLTLMETDAAAQLINEICDPEANIIFGAVISENYENQAKATVIATGFESARIKREPVSFELRKREHTLETPVMKIARDGQSDQPAVESLPPALLEPVSCRNDASPGETTGQSAAETVSQHRTDTETSVKPSVAHPELDLNDPVPDTVASRAINAPKPDSRKPEISKQPDIHPLRTLPQPELELPEPGESDAGSQKLPSYKRRDLGSGHFKRQPELDKGTIAIEVSNYMIPAFLRRKAD